MKHCLEIDSVILEFDRKRVLQDVYLKCETGYVTGLLGRNGTGKTCLMNILYGVLTPNDRSIRIDGKALYDKKRDPFTMRYMPQFSFIPKSLTVKRVFGDFKLDFAVFTHVFPEFKAHYNTPIKKLSGGEKRVIEVYAILTAETKFCMLDEPFSHVMPIHVDRLIKLIKDEKKNKGIIITDHMYSHITPIADQLYLITDGKTHRINEPEELVAFGYISPA